MGCYTYWGADTSFYFSETDECGCLCTFPNNDGERLTPWRLRSLALLGAAVVMCGEEPGDHYLPDCLPLWLREEIKRLTPDDDDVALANAGMADYARMLKDADGGKL